MARINQPRKINPADPDLNKVEKYFHEFAAQFLNNELLGGLLLRNVTLINGQVNTVEHKLNRPAIGWVVTRKNANANVWDEQAENQFPSRSLNLQCSADTIVDLWVF